MKQLTLFVMILVALTSCKEAKHLITPASTGAPYEVLVVIDRAMYERPAGQVLKDALTESVEGLPQPEPQFRVSTIAMKDFDRTFKIFRNIIVVDIDATRYTQTKFKYVRDVNASPQMILTIQSPSEAEFGDFVYKHGHLIVDFFVRAELNRQINVLEEQHSPKMGRIIKEMFDCEMWVPTELDVAKKGENFVWMSESHKNELNFCMYSYPYVSRNTFSEEYFVHKRDSVMAINIPGQLPGMHMATQKFEGIYMAWNDTINVRNAFCQQVRGLWEMTKDNMGGPFISHVRVDTVNQRVIVAEGFVYKPNEDKRNLIRKLEAALYTIQLPAEKVEQLENDGIEEDNKVDNRLKSQPDK